MWARMRQTNGKRVLGRIAKMWTGVLIVFKTHVSNLYNTQYDVAKLTINISRQQMRTCEPVFSQKEKPQEDFR